MYVATPWNPAAPGILIHVGTAAPLPEVATLETACAFADEAANRAGKSDNVDKAPFTVLQSAIAEGCFIPIPLLKTLWHRVPEDDLGAKGLKRRLSDQRGGPPIVGWLGLRFAEPTDRVQLPGGWRTLLELASALASTYVCFYGILTDPVTGLPGRAELNGTLRAELKRAQASNLPFSLLFITLQNLDAVNHRLGRRAGDAVLREFLEVVHGSLRNSDTVMRYGGAVFALPLRDVTSGGALAVGQKIQRRIAEWTFLDGTVQLPCAVGAVSCEGTEAAPLQPLDLLRRADQALSVALQDQDRGVVLWRADGDMATVEHLDPLLGVFTGQTEKDYRNMRLLWEVLQALSSSTGAELVQTVVARIVSLFVATRAALFQSEGETLRLLTGQQRLPDSDAVSTLASDDIEPEEWRLNESALAARTPQQQTLSVAAAENTSTPSTGVAVPLLVGGRALGTLYLVGSAETLRIDQTDFPVLDGVAAQLALALDRDQLAQKQRLREHHERQMLKTELDRLSRVLKQTQFLFRSKAMSDLLNTARRVAVTDATVLITGESGTGKELLAHTLHELSGRRDKPHVIVDCGGIPASLIDSELFGRERGAYTGAERRAEGRLVQAAGGTVFLDEIGELPLEVQAKLLRFVQEKTITMVGGTRVDKVDVRIVAATNRALEDDVRAGRFREDLFHRLNVVRLRIPPLRERPDDVLFLARHFLETFARQHAKDVRDLDADAEELLESYDWPGNVRELQNTLLQAVVLAEGTVVGRGDLQLPEAHRAVSRSLNAGRQDSALPPQTGPIDPERGTTRVASFDDAMRVMADRLTVEVAAAIDSGARLGPPLGKWLARDAVLEAYALSGCVASRAAACLGLKDTTFSRQLRLAESEAVNTLKSESWVAVRAGLADLLRATGRPPGNLVDRLDGLLLDIVVARLPNHLAQAAALMGVSVPTLKRRLSRSSHTDAVMVASA